MLCLLNILHYFSLGSFDHFRLGSDYKVEVKLKCSKYEYNLDVRLQDNDKINAKLPDGSEHAASIINHENNSLMILIDKEMFYVSYYIYKGKITLWTKDLGRFDFKLPCPDYSDLKNAENEEGSSGRITSSMPCKINQMVARVGDTVQIGSPLCITEAMKMEVN